MMKLFTQFGVLLVLAFATGCKATAHGAGGGSGTPDHVGKISAEQLNQDYAKFGKNYSEYEPMALDLSQIKQLGSNLEIEVYFGTWCHDSKREVPRLMKLLDEAKRDDIKLTLYGLDITKSDPAQMAERRDVKYTPTFILMRNGEELGRIIERPRQSLAADLLQMTE